MSNSIDKNTIIKFVTRMYQENTEYEILGKVMYEFMASIVIDEDGHYRVGDLDWHSIEDPNSSTGKRDVYTQNMQTCYFVKSHNLELLKIPAVAIIDIISP